ncbi:MAG: YggS family pyridoxal phosphate enzyme, partial [Myxococcales bacterium]|nr:YggS family pyridoxal phosphate enzyme [Myxococcales bacterium]
LHGVDRAALVEAMARRVATGAQPHQLLLQVNVAGEAQKGGCAPGELGELLRRCAAHPRLVVRGLMTMPPLTDDPERSRPLFRALRELRDRHGGREALPELSMGMSDDYAVAIAEGATLVRIGTAIFGTRDN